MKTLNPLLSLAPEIYLLLSSIYYWALTAMAFNPFAITFISLLFLQLLLKKKILGKGLSIFFILINLYLVLALLSDLAKFPEFNSSARNLLFFAGGYIGLNLVMATLMLVKYACLPAHARDTGTCEGT